MMKHADLTTLTATFPLVQDLIALKETTWFNPATTTLSLIHISEPTRPY